MRPDDLRDRPQPVVRGRSVTAAFAVAVSVVFGCGGCPSEGPPPGPDPAPIVGGVARLTPEQLSQSFRTALGADVGIQGEPNVLGPTDGFSSYVTTQFSIPLGGVDFLARVRDRDSLTKVQTLLAARAIAWPLAIRIVECSQPVASCPDDIFLPLAGDLFTKCNIVDDFPSKDAAARNRWQAQVQDLYLRLFSRNATPEEIAIVESTFERVYQREQSTAPAWLVTLYTLLSSLEAWHTWR